VGCIEGVNGINESLTNFLRSLNAGLQKARHVTYYHSEQGKEYLSIRIPTDRPLKIQNLAELHDLLMKTWQAEDQKGKSKRERQRDLSLPHQTQDPLEGKEQGHQLERTLPPHLKVRKQIEALQKLFGGSSDYGTTLRTKVAAAQGFLGSLKSHDSLYETLTAFLEGINHRFQRALSLGYFGGPRLAHLHIDFPMGKPTPEIKTLAQFYDLLKASKMNYQGTD
jgi:hypothetical protein